MYDILIIGAGVIGCSIARELSKYELDICVIDKENDVATGTSKANSAIIHAGFDAEPGSLKGRLNAIGNEMMDKTARELDFPFKRIGAFVLCFDENDRHKLEELKRQGEQNGVPGLRIIEKDELRSMEPNISEKAVAALYAPSSGIVCPYEMTIALAENAWANGVEFRFGHRVAGIRKVHDIYNVDTDKGMQEARTVINAAGVYADVFNNMVSENKISIIPRKGEYCLFDKEAGNLVSRTVFQLPTELGKGVLVTPTVDGNLLLGPNAVNIEDKEDFTTSAEGLEEIITKGSMSITNLPMNMVITSFAGLRAGSTRGDFIIGEAEDAENFINVAGIESPGLSSALSIADMVKGIIARKTELRAKKDFKAERKGIVKFRELSNEERNELIKEKPEYGRIVCRCEWVTEGEIIEAIKSPLGARTIDGIKRRTRAGMGRCQSGFCTTRVVDIMVRELRMDPLEITKFGGESGLLIGRNKESIG